MWIIQYGSVIVVRLAWELALFNTLILQRRKYSLRNATKFCYINDTNKPSWRLLPVSTELLFLCPLCIPPNPHIKTLHSFQDLSQVHPSSWNISLFLKTNIISPPFIQTFIVPSQNYPSHQVLTKEINALVLHRLELSCKANSGRRCTLCPSPLPFFLLLLILNSSRLVLQLLSGLSYPPPHKRHPK